MLELDAPECEALELVGAVSPTVAERLEETVLGSEFADSAESRDE